MSYRKEVLSPAKINLVLRIGPRRRDGFHEIASLMQKLNWGDHIEFEIRPSHQFRVRIRSNRPELEGNSNLIARAAKLFSEAVAQPFELNVDLTKRIPMEAGLGGGSSNAASTLEFLRAWYTKNFGRLTSGSKLIHQLGSSLGSDVPFFLIQESAAWCTGRGEKIKPLALRSRPILLIFPKQGISTSWAYQRLDQRRDRNSKVNFSVKMPDWIRSDSVQIPVLENDFEDLALEAYKDLSRLKKDLILSGALCGQMTGSGSCFFGIYSSEDSLNQAYEWFRGRFWKCQKVSA